MLSKTLKTIVGLSVVSQAQAGVNFGKCGTVSTMHDLDVSKYQGRWYEV